MYDFERHYHNKDIFDRWDRIRDYLIRCLEVCKAIRSVEDNAFIYLLRTLLQREHKITFDNKRISNINSILFADNKATAIFYLLPYLIDISRKRKRRNNANVENNRNAPESSKLSSQERRDSFILHVEVNFINSKFLHFVILSLDHFSLSNG